VAKIFSEIVTEVGRKIQKTDTAYKTKIKDFCNTRYEQLYERKFWDDLFREVSVVSVSGQNFLVLPKNVEHVLYISDLANDILVRRVGVQNFQKKYLSTLDSQGNIFNYTDFGYSPVLVRVNAADTIEVVSDNAADITQKVYIRGFDTNEIELDESIALNGTTPVPGNNTITVFSITNPRTGLIMVSKDADTTGVISVRETTSNLVLVRLGPRERASRHKVVRFQFTPNSAQTMFVGYKEPLRKLINDGDVTQWSCDDLVVQGAYIDTLIEQRQFQRAQLEENRWEKRINAKVNQEERDSEANDQTMPDIRLTHIDRPRTFSGTQRTGTC